MLKLLFYHGPGDMVTRVIRLLTYGPYSHVELQFTDGCRFFSSGHGMYTGAHMICDRKVYDKNWAQVLVPATQEQENAAQGYLVQRLGSRFDRWGMVSFLFPLFNRQRKGSYCSAIVLDVLQQSLHMFPGAKPKISPNGLYRLIMADYPVVIGSPVPGDAATARVVLGLRRPSALGAPAQRFSTEDPNLFSSQLVALLTIHPVSIPLAAIGQESVGPSAATPDISSH